MYLSIIIPVYNRPEELYELLSSLGRQLKKDFEVIVVDDGSVHKCDWVVNELSFRFEIKYFYKSNGGPALARNYGVDRSEGDYLIFLDSDCILPDGYLEEVRRELDRECTDAFGGPDRAHESFSVTQKAIDYSMTSLLTTGGIRGGKWSADKFYPRSFNMGIRKSVFEALGGFADMRFGEDVDLSYRIAENGYRSRLFPDAWVYHKRRSNFYSFFRQVFNSGVARIRLSKRHPGSLKLVHTFPALFTAGSLLLILLSVRYPILLSLFGGYAALIGIHASIRSGSCRVGCLSVVASFVQLLGYGFGFITGWWRICVCGGIT